jgi:type VI secretion system secreted protein Hcp
MAFNAFLKIKDIPGECTDDKHKDWIEILSYSHGVSQPASGSVSGSGGLSGGRADHMDFSISKLLDKASPKMALFCCSGGHIGEVIIEICRATGDQAKFMEYKLTDTMIRNVSVGGGKNGDDRPAENVNFAYTKIDWNYTDFDAKGKAKTNVITKWDLTANKAG